MAEYLRRLGSVKEMRQQRIKSGVYSDDLYFDNLKFVLPEPSAGKYVLLASFALQAVLIALCFLAYHYKKPAFSCCNMWAVVIASLFIAYQWSYYTDWSSKLAKQAEWNRANLFVPYFVWVILFLMWLAGMMSMLSHLQPGHVEYFTIHWNILSSLEVIIFAVMTFCWFFITWLDISIAWMFRNQLATHYVAPGETDVSLIHLQARAHPSPGSFHYRDTLVKMAAVFDIETSLKADENSNSAVTKLLALHIPFYVFGWLAYRDNKSTFLVVMMVIGTLQFLFYLQFWREHLKKKNRKVRKWCRQHLFFPIYGMFIVNWAFFFTIGSIFLDNRQRTTPYSPGSPGPRDGQYFEDLLLMTDPIESMYFALSLIVLFALLFTQWVLANLHRKGWADGTADVDDGLNYAFNQGAMDIAMGRVAEQQELAAQRAQYAEYGLGDQAPDKLLRKGPLGHVDESVDFMRAGVVKKERQDRVDSVVVESVNDQGADDDRKASDPEPEPEPSSKSKSSKKGRR